MGKYVKGKGIYVGQFSESDLRQGKDKVAVEQMMAKTGLTYTNTHIAKKGGVPVGLQIWVCTEEDWNPMKF